MLSLVSLYNEKKKIEAVQKTKTYFPVRKETHG